MKKLIAISIVTITLVILITGTTLTLVAGSEPAAEVQVADSNTEGIISFEAVSIGSSMPGFTFEEMMDMYPGYLESLRPAQTQTINANSCPTDTAFKGLMDMYPGYLESLRPAQTQTINASSCPTDTTFEELMSMYPGYLEFLGTSH